MLHNMFLTNIETDTDSKLIDFLIHQRYSYYKCICIFQLLLRVKKQVFCVKNIEFHQPFCDSFSFS